MDQAIKKEVAESLKQAATKQRKPSKGDDRAAASGTMAPANAQCSVARNRIAPLHVLTVWVKGTLIGQPIEGRFLVEPGGDVALGPCYGRVAVKGLTVQEAETAIKKHLEKILRAPDVEVLAAGRATRWPGEAPRAPCRIRPDDLLKIQAAGTLLDSPINGDFRVDAQGKVELGEPYGSVSIKGLSLKEAEQAIVKHLEEVLARPEVSVTLTGWKRE